MNDGKRDKVAWSAKAEVLYRIIFVDELITLKRFSRLVGCDDATLRRYALAETVPNDSVADRISDALANELGGAWAKSVSEAGRPKLTIGIRRELLDPDHDGVSGERDVRMLSIMVAKCRCDWNESFERAMSDGCIDAPEAAQLATIRARETEILTAQDHVAATCGSYCP